MKDSLNKFLFRDPSRWQFWMLVAFICKGSLFVFLISRPDKDIPGFWGLYGGDTESYVNPIRHLIANGTYIPDYRMPGYGILYLPFALLFNAPLSYNLLTILQFIVASLTVYPLALIAKYIFKSNTMFYLTFYLFAISTYSNMFDASLNTESFATSFLLLSVFFLVRGLMEESKRTLNLFLAGLLLTEVIFLRPVFIPLLFLFSLVLFVFLIKQKRKKAIALKLFIFLLPFLFFDGLWTLRNYIKYHKIIPAAQSIYYPEIENSYYLPLMTLVRSWGGNDQREPTAEIRWFGLNDGLGLELHNIKVSPPNYIYTSRFNYDSLLILKKQLLTYISTDSNPNADSNTQKALLATIRFKCFSYANSVKKEKPFLYYIIAPIMRTKEFLFHSGTYNLFQTLTSHLDPIRYLIKIIYSLFYALVLGFGAIGIILLSRKGLILTPILLITGIVVYTIVIHPIILGMCEKRYFVPEYPFMLICAAYTLNWIFTKVKTGRGV